MTASYPGAIKTFSTIIENFSDVVDDTVNDMFEEIEAIQAELGTDPAGTFATVDARLDDAILPSDEVAEYSSDARNTVSSGSESIVDFEDQLTDPNSMVTTGASWKFTADKEGLYLVFAWASFEDNSGFTDTEYAELNVYVNGTKVRCIAYESGVGDEGENLRMYLHGETILLLENNDYVQFKVYQNSGNSLTLEDDATHAGAILISAVSPDIAT